MTQHEYNKTLEAQLRMLNKQIDLKIIKGISYSSESRKHKELLYKITNRKSTILSRIFSHLTFQH